jgi:alkanesulfonate monooxygenase SsuD/methylene tetrahydromethanopterin reductase-like flavin-dependent oxidoreductase (luciferase family)
MKTDLLLVPMGATWAELRAAAVTAEEAGFDGLWTWDHLRDPDGGADSPVPEVWTVLSALAEATRRIMLGPLVLNVGSRHPGILANMAATLQEVSGGRLLLGIGAGGNRSLPYAPEYESIGLTVEPDGVRAARVAEACQVMKRLWAGDTSNFTGAHYRLTRPEGFLRPGPPVGAPPIVVGGFGPRMAGIAGRWADGFNTPARSPQLAELVRVARDAHRASGRDPAGFLVTVFAGLADGWLSKSSAPRAALEALGVARLILLVQPPYDLARIRAAGRRLPGCRET